jgi:hypothetical protein
MDIKILDLFGDNVELYFDDPSEIKKLEKIIDNPSLIEMDAADFLDLDPVKEISVYDIVSSNENKNIEFYKFLIENYDNSNLNTIADEEQFANGIGLVPVYNDKIFDEPIFTDETFEIDVFQNISINGKKYNGEFPLYEYSDDYYIITNFDILDDDYYKEKVKELIIEDLEYDIELFNENVLENAMNSCDSESNVDDVISDIISMLYDYKEEAIEKYGNSLIEIAYDIGYLNDEIPDDEEEFEKWVEETTEKLEDEIDDVARKYFEVYYDNSIVEYYKSIYGDKEAYKMLIEHNIIDIDCIADNILDEIRVNEGFAEYYFNRMYAGEQPSHVDTNYIDDESYYVYEVTNLI